ncbi:MAG: alpha/beta fold hydrolase [Actinobacteria bacterium]|nr:alpha/beta fold hydrolase [Actinomycetota bacterium]
MGLAWDSEGDGLALILIHGTGGSRAAWDSVVPLLAPHRRVFAIDLPGCGASPALPAEVTPTVPALAATVERWMIEQDLGGAHLAGNSLGGGIALELAKGQLVAGATVLSPIGFFNAREFAYGSASLHLTRIGAKALSPVAPVVFRSRAFRTVVLWQALGKPWRMSAEGATSSARAMATASDFARGVRAAGDYRFSGMPAAPVTIAWGRRDRILLWRQAERARRLLPDAPFIPLEGCGHVPMTDDPELVAKVILRGSDRDS